MKNFKKFLGFILTIAIIFTMFSTVSLAYTSDNVPKYLFDYVYYANRYPDLKAAFGYDKIALYEHWLNWGLKEGRSPAIPYDPIYYRDNNPDLKTEFGSDYTKLYAHFSDHGINEFRPSSEFYHGAVYKANYNDLQQAFGNNSKSYVEHFVSFGMAEGRKASASSNALGYKKYMNVDANVNTQPKLTYQAQIQNTGWLGVVNDSVTAGTTGENLRLEALKINLTDANGKSCISYRAHVSNDGWQDWKSSGQNAGTVGQSKAIEAMQIKLTGTYAQSYDIYYRMHVSTRGWMGWAANGESAGTIGGGLQAEAIEIKIVKKGSSFNRGGTAYIELTPNPDPVPQPSDGYSQKVQAFLSDSRWKNGSSWGKGQAPKISSYSAIECCAYTADFCKYVFGKESYRAGQPFSNPNEIKAGDVIKVINSQHWFVVLERNGNSLKTAEGNWGGKVVVSNGTYTINNNKLYRNGSVFRTFASGYHMQ